MMNEIQRAHALVWLFRRKNQDWWPTPCRRDSVDFAITEAAEALDAWIRANRPQYARNRDRLNGENAVLDELADCAIMLLTAMGDNSEYLWWGDWPYRQGEIKHVRDVPGWVSSVWETNRHDMNEEAFRVVQAISQYLGMDLCARIEARLDRISRKHNPALRHGSVGGLNADEWLEKARKQQTAYTEAHAEYEAQVDASLDDHNVEPGTHEGTQHTYWPGKGTPIHTQWEAWEESGIYYGKKYEPEDG